ncbi:phage NrS-1 polymerase family protein [Burkholderia pseudomallei]|uniref:phage NrS-1 polymerase family protein n=1 Tax=Burkholderia pseudomallei TaxID=28450 RepID=UPI0021F7987C|nr:AAA family ATPase [Burkholderia pseudomallei]MCV9980959.1 AAA family ATPase [Burkholderia pseudomallei]MCV9987153.1 AAA family ATPase [Burkholderia pseudomallei]
MMSALPVQQKPVALPVNFEGIPASLKKRPQWLLWQYEYDGKRWTKVPKQSNGRHASTKNPDTWATFDKVRDEYQTGEFDGIGIVLVNGLFGIDFDHVLDANCNPAAWADEVLRQFPGTYVERSPSGDGLHLVGLGELVECGKAGPGNRLECYDHKSARYFTMTGHEFRDGYEVTEQHDGQNWLHEHYPVASNVVELVQPNVRAALTDDEIIERASRIGDGERFRKLFYHTDLSDYPSASEADLALCNMFARFTRDADQIDGLFRRSTLFRGKWDELHTAGQTYGQTTISKALTGENAAKQVEAAVPRTGGFVRAADAMAETTTVDWLIDGVMEQGTTCMLFGASASGKSFVAIDWSCCIATGTDWHGQDVAPGAVFYIVGEGQKGFNRRLFAWEKANDVSLQTAPLYLWQCPVPLSDPASVKQLADDIAKVASENEPPRMIVIDTLARNIGGADENSNRDMGLLMNLLDTHLRIPFNATIVIVHHSGNGDKDRLRGASGLTGAVDYEYRVDKKGDDRSLVCKKNKEGEEGAEYQFRIERVPLDDGMSSASLVMLDATSKKAAGAKLSDAQKKCLHVLRDITDIHGVEPPDELKATGPMYPPLVVPKSKWKQESIDAGISKGDVDGKRRAFDRAYDKLVNNANLVGTFGDYVWLK